MRFVTHSTANLKRLADAGVSIALGTDSFPGRGQFGLSAIEEAECMVEAGLSPKFVLTSATSGCAKMLGRNDFGTVAPGLRADLLFLTEDPTENINRLRNLAMVIAGGKIVVDQR